MTSLATGLSGLLIFSKIVLCVVYLDGGITVAKNNLASVSSIYFVLSVVFGTESHRSERSVYPTSSIGRISGRKESDTATAPIEKIGNLFPFITRPRQSFKDNVEIYPSARWLFLV